MEYGQRIAQLRETRGLTQSELAHKLGIKRAALSHYEQNRREPEYLILLRFANVFNVSTDYLLGKETVNILELTSLSLTDNFVLRVDGVQLSEHDLDRFINSVRVTRQTS
jgi:transcriptional regulator with XRE-family HTH domain